MAPRNSSLTASRYSGNDEATPLDREKKSQRLTRATIIFALCAAVNSCNLGYDVGVSTNAGPRIQTDFNLTDGQLELFLGAIDFWSMLGSLGSHYVTDEYGRRRTFLTAAIGFIVGSLVTATANSYEVLMIGRVLVGLGVGVGLAIDPLYIAEVSPSNARGALVSWCEIALNIGILFGFASEIFLYELKNGVQWRVMLACGVIMPVIMIYLVLYVMPESPRWLVARGQVNAARDILEQINPPGHDIDKEISDMQDALEVERVAKESVGWRAILCPTPAVRRMLILGIGTSVIQQAIGIDAIQYYLIEVLKNSGITSEKKQVAVLILLGLVKLVFVFVGTALFDRKGRRPLLFVSLLGCAASLIVVSIAFSLDSDFGKLCSVLGLASYLAFFSSGMGPGGWLVSSEVFSLTIRAKAMSIATFFNRVSATVMASTFLSIAKAITWPGFFILLAGICISGIIFLHIYLPETKGKSLEDMSAYFAEITGDRFIVEIEEQVLRRKESDTLERGEASYGSTDSENSSGMELS